jgi:hypothetical protein
MICEACKASDAVVYHVGIFHFALCVDCFRSVYSDSEIRQCTEALDLANSSLRWAEMNNKQQIAKKSENCARCAQRLISLFTNYIKKYRMPRVVIESPYAGDVALNIKYACACVHDSLSRGEAPYASHLFFTQEGILDDTVPAERDQGINAGFAWGEAADFVAVYEDLGISEGMKKGIERAERANQKVIYRKIKRDK